MGQRDYKVGQPFGITKWGKMGLQSGAAFGLQSGAKRLQSGAGISKWGKGITKWGRDYKVGQGLQSGAVQGIQFYSNYREIRIMESDFREKSIEGTKNFRIIERFE